MGFQRTVSTRILTYSTVILMLGVLFLTLAWTVRATFGLFYVAIVDELAWSRVGGSTGYAISWLMLAVFSPLLGMVIDRWGVRRMMAVGTVILAASLALSATIQSQWQYVLFFGVLGAAGINGMMMSNSVLIPRWFRQRRGTAMGIVAAGYSIGPFLLFPLLERAIGDFGWRETLAGYAVVLLLCAPLALILVREHPGTSQISGRGNAPRTGGGNAAAPTWAIREALSSRRYWALACLYFLGVVSFQVLMTHQVAHGDSVGFDRAVTARVFGVMGGITLVGSLLGGWASDRWGRERVFFAGSLVGTVGVVAFAALAFEPSLGLLVLYAVANGIGFGIRLSLLGVLSADVFLGPNYARILGTLGVANALGGFVGPLLGGYIFDVSQSYFVAIVVSAAALALSGSLVWMVAPKKGEFRPRALAGVTASSSPAPASRAPGGG